MSVCKKNIDQKTMEKAKIMKKFIESRLKRKIQESLRRRKTEEPSLAAFGG